MKLEIINRTKRRIKKNLIHRIAKKTLDVFGKSARDFSLLVIFVGKEEIQVINRTYRKKSGATDVLSFNYSSGYNKKRVEGELFLCPEIIEKSAREHKVSFQKELAFVLSHGILHLLGLRHGKKMYDLQDRISNLKSV